MAKVLLEAVETGHEHEDHWGQDVVKTVHDPVVMTGFDTVLDSADQVHDDSGHGKEAIDLK